MLSTCEILAGIALVLALLGLIATILRAAVGPFRADRIAAAEPGFIAAVSAMLLIANLLDEPIVFGAGLIAPAGVGIVRLPDPLTRTSARARRFVPSA